MIGPDDRTFGFRLFTEVSRITDNLLDLLDYPSRSQNTTGDTVTEGDHSGDTDDHTHNIVEHK